MTHTATETRLPEDLPSSLPRPEGEFERLKEVWRTPTGLRFLTSVNNTSIGLLYIGTALLFWAVNAWLLGRELMDMVWLRHQPSAATAPPLGALTRLALGGIVAGMLLIPFANLLAPVIGAAAATHLVHGRRMRG